MKKKLAAAVFVLVLVAGSALAGPQEFVKGAFYLTPQIGINSWTIPFGVSAEHALTENIGVGGTAMVWLWNNEWIKQSVLALSAEALYHFTKIKAEHFDLYGGAALGYSVYSYKIKGGWGGGDTGHSGLDLGLVAGARYYFNPRTAVSLRLVGSIIGDWAGFGAQLGVTFRIK